MSGREALTAPCPVHPACGCAPASPLPCTCPPLTPGLRERIEAAAAREALEALVPWFGQADALYLRRERDAAYVTSTHNGYTDVRSTWLAEVMTLLAALRAARASDGGR